MSTTPRTRAILDSSPIPFPKRPPKRSASLASLPTPPRTRHKCTRATKSEKDTESESDGWSDHGYLDGERLLLGNKKRKMVNRLETVEEEENSFWMGLAQTKPEKKADSSPAKSVSPAPLLYRKAALKAKGVKAPMSPPPSRRQRTKTVRTPRPVTPEPTISRVRDVFDPIRDSPSNPFLADPSLTPDGASVSEPRTPSPHQDIAEKPTMTYVFRGMKAEFANPLYNLSPSAKARSRLPIEHPDYSPTAACPPKLLFPEAHKRLRRKPTPTTPSPRRHRNRSPSPSPRISNEKLLTKRGVLKELAKAKATDDGKKDLKPPPVALRKSQRLAQAAVRR